MSLLDDDEGNRLVKMKLFGHETTLDEVIRIIKHAILRKHKLLAMSVCRECRIDIDELVGESLVSLLEKSRDGLDLSGYTLATAVVNSVRYMMLSYKRPYRHRPLPLLGSATYVPSRMRTTQQPSEIFELMKKLLTPVEMKVMRERYGGDFVPTLECVAERLGVTHQAIALREKIAIKKLQSLSDKILADY